MKRFKQFIINNALTICYWIAAIIILILVFFNLIKFNTKDLSDSQGDQGEESAVVEESQSPTEIEAPVIYEQGEEYVSLPVYDTIDGGLYVESDISDGNPQGAIYDISSPESFEKSVLNKCIPLNNIYGSQCVNLAIVFWQENGNMVFTTCGTGSARGAWRNETCIAENAGSKYTLIRKPGKIEDGDFVIFNGGNYGHVGMARSKPFNDNKYITLLGLNQNGLPCDKGGSAGNLIVKSLADFLGAYRPKIYHQVEPEPEILPETSH